MLVICTKVSDRYRSLKRHGIGVETRANASGVASSKNYYAKKTTSQIMKTRNYDNNNNDSFEKYAV